MTDDDGYCMECGAYVGRWAECFCELEDTPNAEPPTRQDRIDAGEGHEPGDDALAGRMIDGAS